MASYFVAVLTVLFAVHQQFTAMVAARDQFLERVEGVVLRFIKQRLDLVASNAERVGLSWVPAPLKAVTRRISIDDLAHIAKDGPDEVLRALKRLGVSDAVVGLVKAAVTMNAADVSTSAIRPGAGLVPDAVASSGLQSSAA